MSKEDPFKYLFIETVNNGFIVQDKDPQYMPRGKDIYVFSNPGQLVAWMEKWAVERKKEMGK